MCFFCTPVFYPSFLPLTFFKDAAYNNGLNYVPDNVYRLQETNVGNSWKNLPIFPGPNSRALPQGFTLGVPLSEVLFFSHVFAWTNASAALAGGLIRMQYICIMRMYSYVCIYVCSVSLSDRVTEFFY